MFGLEEELQDKCDKSLSKLLESKKLLKEAINAIRDITLTHSNSQELCNRIDEFLKEE